MSRHKEFPQLMHEETSAKRKYFIVYTHGSLSVVLCEEI
jgi:hypothetical protein